MSKVLSADLDMAEYLAGCSYWRLVLETYELAGSEKFERAYDLETARLLQVIRNPAPLVAVIVAQPVRPTQRLRRPTDYQFTDAQMRIAMAAQKKEQAA
jgi:hypothetical protein